MYNCHTVTGRKSYWINEPPAAMHAYNLIDRADICTPYSMNNVPGWHLTCHEISQSANQITTVSVCLASYQLFSEMSLVLLYLHRGVLSADGNDNTEIDAPHEDGLQAQMKAGTAEAGSVYCRCKIGFVCKVPDVCPVNDLASDRCRVLLHTSITQQWLQYSNTGTSNS